MSKKLILFLSLININLYCNSSFKGLIQAPAHLKNIPRFSVFYLGSQTNSDDEGLFTLPNKSMETNPGILISDFKVNISKKNTVKNLTLSNNSHKYFKEVVEKDERSWKEFKLSNNNIPENTVIVRMDPRLVSRVDNWNVTLPNNLSKLPKIILRENVTKSDLNDSSTKSLLSSLNEKPFHESIQTKVKQYKDKKIKVSSAI